VRLLDPVIGNEKTKTIERTADLKRRPLNNKFDIANYFLDMLMQPNVFMNA